MKQETTPTTTAKRNDALKVYAKDGDNLPRATATAILATSFRHAITTSHLHKAQFGSMEDAPGYGDYADGIRQLGAHAVTGDLAFASELLAVQALSLDNMFTEMARRMALNMGTHMAATEAYARIALKAQAQCRATLEALAKLHQSPEQTVRHVHVNEGGQAVIADQFHHHAGGCQNAEATEQPHAAGTGATQGSPTMLSHDAQWNGLPSPCDQGSEAVPDARRQR
ncbi:hypothetical protein [Niveispirillum fermenti]|uniref:hypothetical protein n=1 Tax=Niveispirillum fermenti TaxID=1233113 RepID=UPI003A8BCE0F